MPAPNQQVTTARLNEIAARLDDHQERLDQHEQRLNKYDVIIASLDTLSRLMTTRVETNEGLLHQTAQALTRLDEKANSNRLWINLVVSTLLVALGSGLALLVQVLLH